MAAVLTISADVPSSKNEGDSGTTVFTFTVTRSVETVGPTTVNFAVTGNTGLDRLDFVGGVLPTGQVSFADGETDKTISIEVAGDFLIESNEVFTLRLSNPSGGATFGTESAIGTIQADDAPTVNPQFSEATASAPFGLASAGKYAAPVFVDIDGDGDLDAFVGEQPSQSTDPGYLSFFENTGDATSPAFSLSTLSAPFGLADLGRRPAPDFVDIDGDGDFDAFVGENDGGQINFFENTGSATAPAFSAATETAPFGFTAANLGSHSTPTFVDIDGDGDLDAFVGESDGTTNFYENTGSVTAAAFSLSTTTYGITDVGMRSAPAFIDIDGEGDLDALIGDFFGNVEFFENTGSSTAPSFVDSAIFAPFGLDADFGAQPTFVDIDSDGDLDAFVGEYDNGPGVMQGLVTYFENVATVSIEAVTASRPEGETGTTTFTFTVSRSGNVGATGTVDFAVTGSGADPVDGTDFVGGTLPSGTVLFAPGETSQTLAIEVSGDATPEVNEQFTVTLSNPSTSTVLDTDTAFTFMVNRNGNTTEGSTVDFVVTGSGDDPADATDFVGGVLPSGTIAFGSGETTQTLIIEVSGDTTPEVNQQFTVTLSNPSLESSIDTAAATGTIVTDDGPVFELSTAPAPLGLTAVGLESRVSLGDLDGDGDLDALVSDATGVMTYFENTGSATAPAYVQVGGSTPFGLPDTGSFSAPALGDLDGDGDLDLLVGVNSGRFKYYENTGDASSAAFIRVGDNAPFGLPDTGDLSTPALVDIDADGDLDLFVGNLDGGMRYFKNFGDVEGAVFVQRGGSIPYGLIDVGSRSTPTLLDLDGDGDFDALVGEGNGRVNYFENTGSAQKRAFAAPVTDNPFGIPDVGRRSAPVAADLDGDGDLDVLVGEEDGNLNLFDNVSPPTLSITALQAQAPEGDTGTSDFTFTVSRTGDVTSTGTVDYAVVAHGGLDAADFDGGPVPAGTVTFGVGEVEQTLTVTVSGDVEVEADEAFVVQLTNVSGGQLGVSQALGIIEADDVVGAPTFELSTSPAPLGLTAVGLESRVTLGDLDGDGDLDALVSDATGVMTYFENTGSATAPAYVQVGGSSPFGLPDTGSFSAPALGDLDGDGDLGLGSWAMRDASGTVLV